MPEWEDIIYKGAIVGIIGGGILGIVCLSGGMGSRGTKDVYTSQYKGKPVIVQRNDIRWGPDEYHVLIDGRDKMTTGELTTDDNKIIKIVGGGYSIRDFQEPKGN